MGSARCKGTRILPGNREYSLVKGALLHEPFHLKRLREQHLRWPDLDVDLTIDRIENPEKYPLIYRNSMQIVQ